MKKISYEKFDENGYFKCGIESARKYTVRGAMKHLEKNGFFPVFDNGRKLQYVWTNGAGTNAHII